MSNPKPNRLILLQPNFTYRIVILRLFVGATIAACRLHAQNDVTLTTLYYFGDADGCQPERPVLAADGSFYVSTFHGGAPGAIFKMTTNGVLTSLHSFNGTDGSGLADMVLGIDGNIYGTTEWGGPGFNGNVVSGDGTVFRMTPAGTLTTLHSFSGPDGRWPRSRLIQGTDGNFYGTTVRGGAYSYCTNCGTIFKISPVGAFTTLVSFAGTNGAYNDALHFHGAEALLQATDGNFYGTTCCASTGPGTVFKMTPSGVLTTLHSFSAGVCCPWTNLDGAGPWGAPVQGTDGNFYGAASGGGAYGHGTIYRMSPEGMLSTLFSFDGTNASGALGLVRGTDGNFYGTTAAGGYGGTIFRVSPEGAFTMLYVFDTIGEGAYPLSPLVQYSDGSFYGTCFTGGNYCGTFFHLSVPGADAPKIAGANKSGSSATLTWLALAGRSYQIQFKTNLDQASWNNSGSPVTATNSTATAFDSVGSGRQRFYRVTLLP